MLKVFAVIEVDGHNYHTDKYRESFCHYGCRSSPGDKVDLTKKFDQVRVWYRWKGYLSWSMENGCWGVASGGIGHQRSFKVTTQGHVTTKDRFN